MPQLGPQTERPICLNWVNLLMVTRIGQYYAPPFQGSRGVAQVHPISPTIFNVVVDAVIQNWVALGTGKEAIPDGLREL